MRFPTMWYVRPAKHTRCLIRAFASHLNIFKMSVKLLTEHNLEFLSLKGGSSAQARLSLHLSKCHIVEDHMLRLISNYVSVF